MLTDINKVVRVDYCKRFVNSDECFDAMLNPLNIDKKWWFLTKRKLLMHCHPRQGTVPGKELLSNCFVKHKSHIIKAMCLCAFFSALSEP